MLTSIHDWLIDLHSGLIIDQTRKIGFHFRTVDDQAALRAAIGETTTPVALADEFLHHDHGHVHGKPNTAETPEKHDTESKASSQRIEAV